MPRETFREVVNNREDLQNLHRQVEVNHASDNTQTVLYTGRSNRSRTVWAWATSKTSVGRMVCSTR